MIFDQISTLLQIEDKRYDLKTDLVKTNPKRMRDYLENYEEVAQFLNTAGFGFFIED